MISNHIQLGSLPNGGFPSHLLNMPNFKMEKFSNGENKMKISKRAVKYFTDGLGFSSKDAYLSIRSAMREYSKYHSIGKSKPGVYLRIMDNGAIIPFVCNFRTHRELGYKTSELLVCFHYMDSKSGVHDLFVPLRLLTDKSIGTHLVYQHSMTFNTEKSFEIIRNSNVVNYTGRTKQGWQTRYNQHLSTNGGAKGFHNAIFCKKVNDARGNQAIELNKDNALEINNSDSGQASFNHCILEAGLSFKQVVEREAYWINKLSRYPQGNNYSPGGWEEINWLKKNGVSFKSSEPSDDEMDSATIKAFKSERLRKVAELTEAQLIARNWSAMTKNPNTLNPETAIEIRMMYLNGTSDVDIFISLLKRMKLSFNQVDSVIKGRTFGWAK